MQHTTLPTLTTVGWALVLGVALGLGLLLAAEAGRHRTRALIAKSSASTLVLALALVRWQPGDGPGAWIVAGLVLSLTGDVCLVLEHGFKAGILAFLLAHLAYVGAFHAVVPALHWPVVLAVPMLLASAVATRWLWPHLGRLRPAVLAYIVAITLMAWGALAVVRAGQAPVLTAAGALLFYVSDLAVARDRFLARSFANRAWGLPAYYSGQVLLALSIGLLGS
jgi:uncharacterized membrane protein YhhN